MKNTVRISLHLEQEHHAALQEMKNETSLSIQWLIRKAVENFIDSRGVASDDELAVQYRKQYELTEDPELKSHLKSMHKYHAERAFSKGLKS